MLLCCLLITLLGKGCVLDGGPSSPGAPRLPSRPPSGKSLPKSQFGSSLISSGLKSVSGNGSPPSPKLPTSSLTPSLVSKESRNESVSDLTTPPQSLGVTGGLLSS